LAAGLPILCEPRDGPADRVIHGDTGFHCVDYDMYLDALKKFHRKEKLRHAMGMFAKDWAKVNLDPRKWVDIVNEVFK
jgi:glycosyltransferase involved in cell wall biosynthesis